MMYRWRAFGETATWPFRQRSANFVIFRLRPAYRWHHVYRCKLCTVNAYQNIHQKKKKNLPCFWRVRIWKYELNWVFKSHDALFYSSLSLFNIYIKKKISHFFYTDTISYEQNFQSVISWDDIEILKELITPFYF